MFATQYYNSISFSLCVPQYIIPKQEYKTDEDKDIRTW